MDDNKSNISEDNNNELKSSFPLFNLSALRKSQSQLEDTQFNYLPFPKIPQTDEEEILQKKFKADNCNYKPTNNIEDKAVARREKKWNDPDVTIREIVENSLEGTPMESEIEMKRERTKKIKAKKAQAKLKGNLPESLNNSQNIPVNIKIPEPKPEQKYTPKVVFKDGKVVIEDSLMNMDHEKDKQLKVVQDKKKPKLTSMSFRTRHHTAKWTTEETRKFYKAIEIFGADFSLIAKLFPTRTREQIKKKFLKEERVNQQKMNQAFQKNSKISKRSLINRIHSIGEEPNSAQNINIDTANLDLNIEDLKNSQRKYSNTSIDSMDMKVIGELQDMFRQGIKQSNTLIPTNIFTEPEPTNVTCSEIKDKPESNGTGKDHNQNRKGKSSQNEKPNLFYKMIR